MEEKRFPVTHSDEEWRKLLTPEGGFFSRSQQASQSSKSQAAFDLRDRSLQFTSAPVRDTAGEHGDNRQLTLDRNVAKEAHRSLSF
jgi:hypothetical protein